MKQKIKKLTKEQEKQLLDFKQQWFDIGCSTESADRKTAENVIEKMYSIIGEQPPKFIWVDSPATACLMIKTLSEKAIYSLRASLWASLSDSLWDSLQDSLGGSLRGSLEGSLNASLSASLNASLWASLSDSLQDSLGDSLRDSLCASLSDSLQDSLGGSLRASLEGSLRASLRGSLSASLRGSLSASLWDSLQDSLGGSLKGSLRASLQDSLGGKNIFIPTWLWGQQDAYWIAFYLFTEQVLKIKYDSEKSQQLKLWSDLAKSCGWWYPYKGVCIICERPEIVKWEYRENMPPRLHCSDGPALLFRDGWEVHYWKGLRLNKRVIEQPETITVEEIDKERNLEIKRAKLEINGFENYIKNSGAKEINRDEYGVLYHRDGFYNDEPLALVRVINSTPEHDGTKKEYFIPVTPQAKTAHEAVASTFGLTADQYRPLAET